MRFSMVFYGIFYGLFMRIFMRFSIRFPNGFLCLYYESFMSLLWVLFYENLFFPLALYFFTIFPL